MKKLAVFFGLGAILILAGAGCGNQGISLYTDQTTSPDTGGVVTASTNNSGWKHYENKKFGVSFDYPSGWSRADNLSDEFLSVRLGSADCVSSACPPDFAGVEIRAGVKKVGFTDLSAWVQKQINSESQTNARPRQTEVVSLGGRGAIKISVSDWSGATAGPGYYINQDQYYFIYIATGRNDMTPGALEVINKIVGSVRVFANDLPPVDVDEGDEVSSPVPPEIRNGKLYTNEAFKMTMRYPEDCVFVNNSDQVYPPVQVELFICNKDEKDKTVAFRIVSSTIDQEVKNAFGGRKLKYNETFVLVSDQRAILLSFAKGGRNAPERYVFLERAPWVYVMSVKNDTKNYTSAFDKMLAGFHIDD